MKIAVGAKISQRSRAIASEIGEATGERQIDIIEKALLIYRRQWRMEQVVIAFASLKEHPQEWQSYQDEAQELEGTVGDGLEEEN